MHEYRKYAVGEVSKLENITVIYVISDKKTVPHDHTQFYNIVAAFTLEQILKHAEKINTAVSVRFGHVRGFDHSIEKPPIWAVYNTNNTRINNEKDY